MSNQTGRTAWKGRTAAGIAVAFAAIAVTQISTRGEGPDIPKVILNVAPAAATTDPGPSTILGQADGAVTGTQFAWVDLTIEGAGNCRVYFDYKNAENYHFVERHALSGKSEKTGLTAVLGICEAGIEEEFAAAPVNSSTMRIARHGSHIALFQEGRLVLSAFDERISGGAAGFRMLGEGEPVKLKGEAREDIHFSDDFMVTEERSAQWRGNGSKEKGDFGVFSLKNPLLSANAFCYMGKGHDVYSVVGQPWWDQYTYAAALRGPLNAQIGLIFAFQDNQNYGLFRWNAQFTDAAGAKQPGKRELIRVRGGKPEVLAAADGGYVPNQWYRASIRVAYDRATVSVDGHKLLDVSDPSLCCGGAGVWCDVPPPATAAVEPKAQAYQFNSLNELMKQHAVFDDVKIDTFEGVEDNFGVAGKLCGGWLVGNGEWNVEPPKAANANAVAGNSLVVSPPPSGVAKALIGDRRWSQYQVDVDVTPGVGGAGIVFLHRDESNYYTAAIEDGQLKIVRAAAGLKQAGQPGQTGAGVVDSAPLAHIDGPIHLSATICRGHIKVTASAPGIPAATAETFDTVAQLRGRSGLLVNAGAGVSRFEHFNVTFIHESEPLITTNAVFEDELTMNDWTNPTSEWHPSSQPYMVDNKPVNMFWHRSQFPGDVELSVEPRDFPDPKFEIALSLAKNGQGHNNGYIFRYRSGDSAEGASRTITTGIERQGKTVAENVVADDNKQLTSLSFRRCGKYVVGLANGQPILSFRDESPLSGSQVAYYTKGVTLRSEATKIESDNFRNELFSSAPVAWRTAGPATIAEVTNRWQCDPRWSFFSLKSEVGKAAPAVLWSKTIYSGDVTVEFFGSNKMEGERGPPYTYARDMNVTICSDGSDLTKGYTFHFGGNGNTGSFITRNGLEVKRSAKPVVIPTDMNFHRHWFAIKVEKHGSRVSFRVDKYFADEKNDKGEIVGELAFDDPHPLSGNRVAVWTYNHAIMISRVRISGEGGETMEEPGVELQPLKSPYDGK